MDLPKYKSHKTVGALKITGIIFGDPYAKKHSHPATLQFGDEYKPLEVSAEYVKKHQPEVGGYFVEYEDGYQSFSPAEAFESGYTKLET